MKTMLTAIILMVIFQVSCGSVQDSALNGTKDKNSSNDPNSTDKEGQLLSNGDYFNVDGYVSPINISVNGKQYRDSEDFYTQELKRLQSEVKKEYAGYQLSFDAAVGLRNFKTGMYVFLVAANDTGVASEAYVDSTGKFSFMLDGKVDKKAMYTLRATKRIGLRLTKGEEVISWCYNMYAEKEIALETNPVVLRSFETVVTQYQCSEQSDGIQLPEREQDIKTEMDQEWADANDKEVKRTAAVNAQAKKEQESPAPSTPTPTPTSTPTPTPTPTSAPATTSEEGSN